MDDRIGFRSGRRAMNDSFRQLDAEADREKTTHRGSKVTTAASVVIDLRWSLADQASGRESGHTVASFGGAAWERGGVPQDNMEQTRC